jgi:DNA-binding response OmpR family regulator
MPEPVNTALFGGTMNQAGRIIIADDDDAFRETLACFLRKHGYECICAPDSTTAVELLGASEFDLLIADIQMPGNDNLELIRELPRVAAGLPVVLLTGHPSMESAVESVRLPVVAYLLKPPNLDELRAVVHQSIERHRTYRIVTANRQRLQTWLSDLTRLEELLRDSPENAVGSSVHYYLALTFQNQLMSLLDLKQVIQALADKEGKVDAVKQLFLVEALREAIEVLAKTRQSFKSKELGDLRRKLEGLIRVS